MYKKEYVQTFLEKQGQLFDEPVADDFDWLNDGDEED